MPTSSKRVALVTGGSRGIGLGIAEHLADAGYNLVINGRRPQSDVQDTLDALTARGAELLYRPMDVSNLDEHQAMLDAINEKFGRLDSLVNNAGVAPNVRADILEDEASPESFDRLININLRGPYFLTQAAAKWMVAQKKADADFKGTIINVSSISATVVSVNRGDYCISKAGVAMATQLWAARLGEYGLGVFEVRPGVIRTDMTAGVTEKYDKLFENGLAVEPRWGEPSDIGKAVTALASGDMTYATGNVFMVDGGLTIQRL
ncbi:MAG: 3-ketoacyl-ACP reductase [Planctomycetota bacterium]